MNGASDINETAPADDGGELDPREAATLIEQTKRQARRKLEPSPPLLSLIRAVIILAAYGAIWLSVRDSTPTRGRLAQPWLCFTHS